MRGFSLLDTAVAVAILGLLVLAATPGILGRIPHYDLRNAQSAVFSELRAARRLSLSESRSVSVDIAPSLLTVTVKIDRNDNGIYEEDELSVLDVSRFGSISLQINSGTGIFRPRGTFWGPNGLWEIKISVDGAGDKYVYAFPGGLIQKSDEQL